MNVSQLLSAIWARRRLVLLTFFGLFGATVLVTLLLPKEYVANAAVVIDSRGTDLVTGTVLPNQIMSGYISTQVDVIGSHNVALKVVDQLKLVDAPQIREKFNESTDGSGDIRDWIADNLLRNLDILPDRDSSVVTIAFSARDPNFAAAVANAFADSYIRTNLELRNDPTKRQAAWFDEQIQSLRKNLETAQQNLAAFQREHNLVSIDPNRIDVENSRLAEIANQLVAAQGSKYDSMSRLNQLKELKSQDRLTQLPDILGNPLLQSMKADLVRAEGKLADTAERFDRNHPQYVSAAAEVNALRQRLAAEIATARGSIEQSANLAQRREQELQQALAAQKQAILELQKQRDQQAVLSSEVENAQHVYDAALQRSSTVRLDSQLTQSNIAVLNSAVPPLKPTKPRLLINVVLGAMAGLLFGIAAALVREFNDRRIREREDIIDNLSLPVLAELPPLASRTRFRNGRLTPA